ncbi:UvrABC system protein B, partial [Dissostichus eleginoides]
SSGLYKAYYANEKSVGNGFVPYHPGKESLFSLVHCIWKQPPGLELLEETPFGKVPGSVGFTLPPKPNCNHQRSKHDTDLRSVSRGKSILLPVREAHMQSIWNSFLYPLRKVQVRSLGVLPEELSDSSVALKGETPEVFGTVANSQYNRNPIQLGRGAGGEFLECYPCVTHPGS